LLCALRLSAFPSGSSSAAREYGCGCSSHGTIVQQFQPVVLQFNLDSLRPAFLSRSIQENNHVRPRKIVKHSRNAARGAKTQA
jgi:hypothetical protein